MNFNSWQFLIYLPVVVGMYWLLPHRFRWIMLLIVSYYFYMSWNAWLIILIMTTTVTAYVASNLMKKTQSRKVRKALLIVTLVICLGILVFFKYINFLLETAVGVIRLFNAEQDSIVLNVILPVGISFYTFQTLSYVVDVYRGDFEPEPHFGYFALYVVYFPQLVAGPIERPGALLPQLREEHKFSYEDFTEGIKWLISGFFRKVVVARSYSSSRSTKIMRGIPRSRSAPRGSWGSSSPKTLYGRFQARALRSFSAAGTSR